VPAKILKKIDDHAQRIGDTRSGFLVRAAEQAISNAPRVALSKSLGERRGPRLRARKAAKKN